MNNKFLEIKIWIVNHLGKNPINGGIPANERKLIRKNNLIFGLKFHIKDSCDTKNVFVKLKIIAILIVVIA